VRNGGGSGGSFGGGAGRGGVHYEQTLSGGGGGRHQGTGEVAATVSIPHKKVGLIIGRGRGN
jgi:hypothetical protein